MAIDSLGAYSSISNTGSGYPERKAVQVENVTVGENTASRGAQLVKSTETNTTQSATGENTKKDSTDNYLKSALSVANQKIRMTNTRCEFEYHDATRRVSIKVIDKTTDEVVREIPPEETLEMVEKIWELAGLIVDERR